MGRGVAQANWKELVRPGKEKGKGKKRRKRRDKVKPKCQGARVQDPEAGTDRGDRLPSEQSEANVSAGDLAQDDPGRERPEAASAADALSLLCRISRRPSWERREWSGKQPALQSRERVKNGVADVTLVANWAVIRWNLKMPDAGQTAGEDGISPFPERSLMPCRFCGGAESIGCSQWFVLEGSSGQLPETERR